MMGTSAEQTVRTVSKPECVPRTQEGGTCAHPIHHSRRQATFSARSRPDAARRSEEHTSELQSLMRISYAVFCLKKNNNTIYYDPNNTDTTIKNTEPKNI